MEQQRITTYRIFKLNNICAIYFTGFHVENYHVRKNKLRLKGLYKIKYFDVGAIRVSNNGSQLLKF